MRMVGVCFSFIHLEIFFYPLRNTLIYAVKCREELKEKTDL